MKIRGLNVGNKVIYLSVFLVILLVLLSVAIYNLNTLEKEKLLQLAPPTDDILYYDFDTLTELSQPVLFDIGGGEDKVNLGDSLPIEPWSLSEDHLRTVLGNEIYNNGDGDGFEYNQNIYFSDNFVLKHKANGTNYSVIGLENDNGEIFTYSLTFTTSPSAGFEGTMLRFLGKEYYVQSYDSSAGMKVFDSILEEFNVTLNESGGGSVASRYDGDDIVGLKILSIGAGTVTLEENLVNIGTLSEGDTYELSEGVYLGVKKINYVASGFSTVELVVGNVKTDFVNGGNIKVNDEDVEGYAVSITDSGSFELSIVYSENLFLEDGMSFDLPVFETLSFGLNVNDRQERGIVSVLNNSERITFSANINGVLRKIDLLSVSSTGEIRIGNSTDKLLAVSGNSLDVEADSGLGIVQSDFITTFSDAINSVDRNNEMMAQTFLLSQGSAQSINEVKLFVKRTASNDKGFVKMFLTGVDVDEKPDLSNILSELQEINISNLSEDSYEWISLSIPVVTLDIGESYAVVINGTNIIGTDANNFAWAFSDADPYADGEIHRKAYNTDTWNPSGTGRDFAFELKGFNSLSRREFFASVGDQTYGESYLLNVKDMTISDTEERIVLENIFDGAEEDLNVGEFNEYGNVKVEVKSVLAGRNGFSLEVSPVDGIGTGSFEKIYTDSGLSVNIPTDLSGESVILEFEEEDVGTKGESFDIVVGKTLDGNLSVKGTSLQEFSDTLTGRNVSYVVSGFATRVEREGNLDNSSVEIKYYGEELYGELRVEEIGENIYSRSALLDLRGGESIGTIKGVRLEEGQFENAAMFTGNGEYVEVGGSPDIDSLEQGSYTLAAWYRPLGVPGDGHAIIAKSENGLAEGQTNLYPIGLKYKMTGADEGFAMTHYEGSSGYEAVTSGPGFGVDGDYLVTGVVDRAAGKVKIYVNGILEDTRNIASITSARTYDSNWRIGISNINSSVSMEEYSANGLVDEVKMWDRALTDSEVSELYNSYEVPSNILLIIPENCAAVSLQSAWNAIFKRADFADRDVLFTSGAVHGGGCSDYFVYGLISEGVSFQGDYVMMGSSESVTEAGDNVYNITEESFVFSWFNVSYENNLSEFTALGNLSVLSYLPNDGGVDFIRDKVVRFSGNGLSKISAINSILTDFNGEINMNDFHERIVMTPEENLTFYDYGTRHLGGDLNLSISANYSYILLDFYKKTFVSGPDPEVPLCNFELRNTTCSEDTKIRYPHLLETANCRVSVPVNETFIEDCDSNNITGRLKNLGRQNLILHMKINGTQTDGSGAVQTGKKKVEFIENGSVVRVEFEHDFDSKVLDLSSIEIIKQDSNDDFGYLIVRGIQSTKTIRIDRLDSSSDKVCIEDRDGVTSVSDISRSCGGSFEYEIDCDGTREDGFTCEESLDEDYYIVSGLSHSGVKEYVPSSGRTPNGGNNNGGGNRRTTTPNNNSGSGGSGSGSGSGSGGSGGSGTDDDDDDDGGKVWLWIIIGILAVGIISVAIYLLRIVLDKGTEDSRFLVRQDPMTRTQLGGY
tara:strand:- start:5459 stop:10042 length:4584 start_codon:yes stop_codon:yes gene_type:complete